MLKIFNYIGYFICSFIPLFSIIAIYYFIIKNILLLFVFIILILYGLIYLTFIINTNSTSILVASYKEIKFIKKIDFSMVWIIFIFICMIIIDFNCFVLPIIILAIILILYKIKFVFISYTLILLGYKTYIIRNKLIYSKKTDTEMRLYLKNNKYIQIKEITDNILIEKETYIVNKYFCT